MSLNQINEQQLEQLIRQILSEQINQGTSKGKDFVCHIDSSGVASVKVPTVRLDESNRLKTDKPSDRVYTKDLFTLNESPRLGCGMMEMHDTTFDWFLDYDEIDYVIEGRLSIIVDGRRITADKGEIVYIPKGTKIKFSVEGFARFMYVTYPADWASQ